MAALKALIARWRSESGAEFVEFALALPLLLLVVMGIMDFGLMFQQYEVITNAAREGARVGALQTSGGYTLNDARQRALDYVNAALITGGKTPLVPPPANIAIPIVVAGVTKNVCGVNVQVGYPHQ